MFNGCDYPEIGDIPQMEKEWLSEAANTILIEEPELFPVIKSSYLTKETENYVLQQIPHYIRYVKKPTYAQSKMVVELDPRTIIFIPEKYKAKLKVLACKKNPELIRHFLDEIWKHEDLMELIQYCPASVRYFPKIGKRYIDYAVSIDPNVEVYFPDLSAAKQEF